MTEVDISKVNRVVSISNSTSLDLINDQNKFKQLLGSTISEYSTTTVNTIQSINETIRELKNGLQANMDKLSIQSNQIANSALTNKINGINTRLQALRNKVNINEYNYGFLKFDSDDNSTIVPPSLGGDANLAATSENIHGFFINASTSTDNIGAKKSTQTLLDKFKSYTNNGNVVLNGNNIYYSNGGTEFTGRNANAKRQACYDALKSLILQVPENGLFIFMYGGHGSGKLNQSDFSFAAPPKNTTCQHMAVCGGLYDGDIWEIFKLCRGRIFAIFDCCFAGTMYGYQVRGGQPRIPIFPFGEQSIQDDSIESITFGDVGVPTARDVTPVIYPGGNGDNSIAQSNKNWMNKFQKDAPVYVKLSTTAVKMCAFSASPEQSYGWSNPGTKIPMSFTRALCNAIDSAQAGATYADIFNQAYVTHYTKPWMREGIKVIRASLCTYTNGFDPTKIPFIQ